MSLESEINKHIIHKLEQELGMYKCMEGKYRDMKIQRDTLIDDIAVVRANNKRLEEENKNLKDKEFKLIMENNDLITISSAIEQADDYLRGEIERLERENEKLKSGKENLTNRVRNLELHLQILHDELMSSDGEVRYWKDKYTTLTNHIRDMKFASPYSYNYIHLVNFIKGLEGE